MGFWEPLINYSQGGKNIRFMFQKVTLVTDVKQWEEKEEIAKVCICVTESTSQPFSKTGVWEESGIGISCCAHGDSRSSTMLAAGCKAQDSEEGKKNNAILISEYPCRKETECLNESWSYLINRLFIEVQVRLRKQGALRHPGISKSGKLSTFRLDGEKVSWSQMKARAVDEGGSGRELQQTITARLGKKYPSSLLPPSQSLAVAFHWPKSTRNQRMRSRLRQSRGQFSRAQREQIRVEIESEGGKGE